MIFADTVFYGALAFLLGIGAAGFGWNAGAAILATLVLGIPATIFYRKLDLLKRVLLFALLVFAGIFYYHFRANLTEAQRNLIFDKETEFSGIVINEPRGFEKYQIATLRAEPPFSGKVAVFTSPLAPLEYGDLLKIKGAVKLPPSDGEKPAIFFPEIEILERGRGNKIKAALVSFKEVFINQFNNNLGPEEAALLSGITLGARSDFSEKFRGVMAKSGTTHLVALSGYNITILVLAIAFALGSFLSRRKTFYTTIAVIVAFVLMVGGEPSVVRAAIMGFLALLAKEVGRLYSVRNAIALTAAAMVSIQPTLLANDVGFQLSFISLLGIVYLGPILKNLFGLEGEGFAAWKENALLTASAQLAVFPIIVNTFGEFSVTAILANILILGLVPLTMFLGFLLAALSSIYVYLGFFAAKLVELLLKYEIWIMELFSEIRLPIGSPSLAPAAFLIAYYAVLGFFVYHFSNNGNNRNPQKN